MKKITSVNNDLIKETVKLKQKKYIVSHGQFLVEGKNIIEEAIKSNIVKTIFVSNTNLFKEFSNRIEVTEEIISKLSSNESNIGAIALCENVDIDFNIDSFNKIVVLDKISNPGNFGSIIRTAKALGYDAVITMGESVYK
jgi:TrmH family RNA methyltransferase